MARIRTIKPEFPQSESVGKLSRDARLLFIQLWTIVDDAGRTRAASRMLASLLYPYDDDARTLIDGWLDELAAGNMIRLYEAEGARYLEIVKWLEHQKIDRPSPSKIPAFTQPLARPREDSRILDADLVPSTSTKDQVSSAVAKATRPLERFDEFWQERPRRKGDDPRKPAEEQFARLVKSGESPDAIIAGVKLARLAYASEGKIGTEYVPQMVKWLRDRRYRDYATAKLDDAALDDCLIEVVDDDALSAWDAYSRLKNGKTFPRNARGGWRFPSKYPPGYQPSAGEASPPVIPQLSRMSPQP